MFIARLFVQICYVSETRFSVSVSEWDIGSYNSSIYSSRHTLFMQQS